jgi:hypothetical protein
VVALADGLGLFEPGDVLRRLQVEPVETGREQDRCEAVLRGGAGDVAEPFQRLVARELGRNVDPPLRVNLPLAPEGGAQGEERNQYALLHGFLSVVRATAGGELDSTLRHWHGQWIDVY